jgi:flagellar basal-body rod modification protein FlgD
MSFAPVSPIGPSAPFGSSIPLGVMSGYRASDANSGSSAAPASSAATAAAASNGQLGSPGASLDREAFLKLLVAQLRNQDPSKPVDASEMISQSAQLTMVDKLEQIQQSLGTSTNNNRLALAGSLIGKRITFQGSNGTLVSEIVTGATFDIDRMLLRAGGWQVPLDAIRAVEDVPATPTPPATTVTPAPTPTPTPTPTTPAPTPTTTTDPAPAA